MEPLDLRLKPRKGALGDVRWALIERIAASPHLRSSIRLQDFLFYVADCAIRNAPEEATEQQIGIKIFHRNPGYNSSEDSIVRTHARLLRQKLSAYFAVEGIAEGFVVDIPKGHYLPVFRRNEIAALPESSRATTAQQPAQILPSREPWTSRNATRPWKVWRWRALSLLVLALVSGVSLWSVSNHSIVPQTSVSKFWQPFFVEDPPLVIFSNALFIGNSKTGLRYADIPQRQNDPATNHRSSDSDMVDTYTGIGELASVYALTTLFDSHQSHFILKRSQLVTWDEAMTKNIVFIGSTAENPSLQVLESSTDFTIAAEPGTASVVNHHPKPGEPPAYSRPDPPLINDFAILALLPGVQPGKHTLIFSGLTTLGTQAATEFMCRPEGVNEVLRQITGPKGEVRPFEAVLETTIRGGVPLRTRLVTLHLH
jgi:hypothetical protein